MNDNQISRQQPPPAAREGVGYGDYFADFVFEHYLFPDMWDYGNHAHPMMQYSMVLRGSLSYSVGQRQFLIPEGSGFFVNYNRFHRAIADPHNEVEFLSFLISPEFVTGRAGGQTGGKYANTFTSTEYNDFLELPPHDPSASVILENMRKISDASRHRNFGYELIVKSLAVEIWLHTVLLMRETGRRAHAIAGPNMDQTRIDQIVTYIHLYYRNKLALADLANSANISQGECCRLFARTVGATPIEYLNRYRISQAQLMLRDTHSSILQIAQETGFPSINHFINLFKRFTGCTPREYRTRIQQADGQPDPSHPDMVKVTHN